MRPHHHVSISEDAKVKNGRRWISRDADDQYNAVMGSLRLRRLIKGPQFRRNSAGVYYVSSNSQFEIPYKSALFCHDPAYPLKNTLMTMQYWQEKTVN